MKYAIGIDEVGRGSWAGPLLVVAARQKASLSLQLADSKKLSRIKRQSFMKHIKLSCDIGEGWVGAAEIDSLGLSAAMKLGVTRALGEISARSEELIIMDGAINYCNLKFKNVRTIIKADATYPIVSAASIHGKVTRDRYMSDLGAEYKLYSFEKHVGYGTKYHLDLLKIHGISNMHRRSFAPIKALAVI
ncbi:ribonuclease HII [Candidatus Saccharibacteria bacterium]|nr:ribonuclease HII [Candidatus Saccharibacteria bacterium]